MQDIAIGSLVYLDTYFSGLIPGKVVSVDETLPGGYAVGVRHTADRAGYGRGEVRYYPASAVMPRKGWRRSRTQLGRMVYLGGPFRFIARSASTQ